MISHDYLAMLEQRECRGGCGLKFKVLPQSKQQFARGNCESYCREFRKKDYMPSDPVPNSALEPLVKKTELQLVEGPIRETKSLDLPVILTSKEPEMLAKETSVSVKESTKVLKKKPDVSELVELDKKASEKLVTAKASSNANKDIASKISKAKQIICKACIDDARKLLNNVNLLSSKMEIVYLHKTYCDFGDEKAFFEALSLTVEDFTKWKSVYFSIYERLSSKDWIQKYPVDDIYPLCHQINEDDSEGKIRQIVEEKLAENYKTATYQSDKALTNLLSFYEKISFDLLGDESLDSTYVLVKRLYNRFRSQMDKKVKR